MVQVGENQSLYSISEVARGFGISVPALRFYEQQGLVVPTARRAGVRYYDFDALRLLAYAMLWHRDAGMTVEASREIMEVEASVERHTLIAEHLSEIDAKVRKLNEARKTLSHLLDCSSDDPMACSHTGAALARRVRALMDSAG